MNRFLHAAYGHALPEHCSGRLESAVNRISGRLLLKLTATHLLPREQPEWV